MRHVLELSMPPGEIVIVKCEKCGKKIFVNENCIRPKMFCTLGCMDSSEERYLKQR